MNPAEKKFLEAVATYSKIPKDTWIEIFKVISATTIIQFVGTEMQAVEIPFLGTVKKDGTFVLSDVIDRLVKSNEDERLEMIEDTLIKQIKTSALERLRA